VTKFNKSDQAEAKEYFTKVLPNITHRELYNHDTNVYESVPIIYTKVTKVAPSGMSRWIQCYISSQDGISNISWFVACLTGNRYDSHNGVFISGCGMDMGFELIYQLAYAIDDILTTGKTGYKLKQEWM
jgi:hypothetical protein